ncbi:MAG: hypothetical protein KIT84_08395 [Labilithrix sp.]|nr:hypothetical protein [Labilithrix sp.]MCW5811017.1 hypothetical protein [Labilithrix sp.]
MSLRGVLFLGVAAAGALSLFSIAHAQELETLPAPAPSSSDGGGEPAIVYEQADAGAEPDAAGPAPAPASAPPQSEEDAAKKHRLSFRGAGGFQYQQVNGIPVTGARVRLGVGSQTDTIAHYGGISVLYGATENDLRTWDVRLGYTGDLLRMGVLRLGGTAETGYLFIRRATIDKRMYALGIGAGVHLGVDLFPFGPRNDHAVTAEARFDAHLHFGSVFVWGPSVLLGFRY